MHNNIDVWLMGGRVNSKATARFQMKDLISLVPGILHHQLRRSRYYAPKSETLVIQADGSRRQSANVDQCFQILRDQIIAAGKIVVRGETSPEQKARVKKLYVRYCTVNCQQDMGVRYMLIYIRYQSGKKLEMKNASELRIRTARRSAIESLANAPRMAN